MVVPMVVLMVWKKAAEMEAKWVDMWAESMADRMDVQSEIKLVVRMD